MKVRIFYLVSLFFSLARCGVVPQDFKSTEDEEIHTEELFTSNGTNSSIPTLRNNTEFHNASSSALEHHLKTSQVLVSDSHIDDVPNNFPEEDLAVKKLSKVSGRSKKKSPKDSTRFKKPPQEEMNHADENSNTVVDDHSLEFHHPQTDNKAEDSKSHGSVEVHSSDSHHPQIDHSEDLKFSDPVEDQAHHKVEDINFHGSVDDHASDSHHPQTHGKAENTNFHGSVDDHSSDAHHLQTDHKADSMNFHGSVDDHSSDSQHPQTNNTTDLNFHGSVDDHFPGSHHPQTDGKAENINFNNSVDDHSLDSHHPEIDHPVETKNVHDLVDNHSSDDHHLQTDHKSEDVDLDGPVDAHPLEPDHISEDLSDNNKIFTKGHDHMVNITSHVDWQSEDSKDFANKSEVIMSIFPEHDKVKNVETEFMTKEIDDEIFSENATPDANNLNMDFSNDSIIDILTNSSIDLTHSSNISTMNISDAIIYNSNDFSSILEDYSHGLNHTSQDRLNNSADATTSDLKHPVLDITEDSNHSNENVLNDSFLAQSSDLVKPVREVEMDISDNLNKTTVEFENESPEITENIKEPFGHMENTENVPKPSPPSIMNSKLFLNIHNTLFRRNVMDQINSAQSPHEDETSESLSKASGENLNKPSERDTISPELMTLEGHPDTLANKEDIHSPSGTNAPTSEIESKSSSVPSREIPVNPKLNNKLESDLKEDVDNKTSQGLFSSLGLGFLMNSELAKNAASAMEVFNLTDSALTDHIIDDQNDVHDLLNIRSSVEDHNLSNSESIEQISSNDSSIFVTDNPKHETESSTLRIESSSVDYDDDDAVNHELSVTETGNLIRNESFINGIKSSESSNKNVSIEDLTPKHNTSAESGIVTTASTILLNSTVEFEVTTISDQPDARNASDIVEVQCPPPGICIFWFFAQDTCTVNSHCLGSRICCRMGCSKTCVEI